VWRNRTGTRQGRRIDRRSFDVGMFVMLSRCKPQTNGIESICREIMAMRHLHHTTSMATHKGI
jgi:hypothetical protein